MRPSGLSSSPSPATKSFVSGRVREDVVAQQQVGEFAFGLQFSGKRRAKKFRHRGHAILARDFGDVGGGFDAEAGNLGRDKILKQVAVVAGDFDDQALRESRANSP